MNEKAILQQKPTPESTHTYSKLNPSSAADGAGTFGAGTAIGDGVDFLLLVPPVFDL